MKKIAFLILIVFSFISSQAFAFDEISAFENNKNEYNLGYKNIEKLENDILLSKNNLYEKMNQYHYLNMM